MPQALESMSGAWRWLAGGGTGRLRFVPPLLLLIVAVALALRLYGIYWDQGNFFQPDERSIFMRVDCMYRLLTHGPGYQGCTGDFPATVAGVPTPGVFFDADRSPLNPHWFPLGSIIIYMLLIVRVGLSPFMHMDLGNLALAGRTLSALADVGTVVLVYLIGRRLFSRGFGLLAAAFVALAVTHIQNSHIYRPETFTVLFIMAAFWLMLRVMDRGRLRDSALLGLFVGLAFATKVSVLPILLPLGLTYGYLLYRARRLPERGEPYGGPRRVAFGALTGGAVALATFLFWMPYAVIALPEFLDWISREAGIAREAGTVPYTIQYIGARPFVYELQQTSLWGLGLPLGLVAWGGLVFMVFRNLLRPNKGHILLLLWAVPLFLTVGAFETKFLRYSFPLIPVLILLGSGALYFLHRWVRERRPRLMPLAQGLVLVVVAATAFYALAFESVYSRPHTAVQASRYINDNVPRGATILTDNHWDEGIPNLGYYRVTQLPMYEGDTVSKMERLADDLASGDYLIFYSNRPYGSIARVPQRYPLSSNYYHILFSGQLGYQLERSFTSYPQLLGVAFVDDTFTRPGLPAPEPLRDAQVAPLALNLGYADENVIDYDHPKVLLFRNVAQTPASDIFDLLLSPDRAREQELPLTLSAQELEVQRAGGTWSALFSPDGFSNRYAVVVWLLLVGGIALATLPLSVWAFRFLPDRGVAFARPLGLLVVAYLTWLAASLGWLTFSRGSFLLAFLALGIVSGLVAWRTRRDLVAFLRQRWRYLLLVEGLFLVAFLSFLALRMANPDLWHPFRGGEKPMDFAYLNAIIRSTSMPPYDPWFAGGYLNYYYFGLFMAGALIKVTGIVPEVAYNLAIPLIYAMTATLAFSLVYNLAETLRRRRFPRASARGPILAGLAALFFLAIMGNLGGAAQLLNAAWGTLVQGEPFPAFNFWSSSRMMPGQISITEFPFWSFLLGDLHAHIIAIPYTLLTLGLALNLALGGGSSASRAGYGARILLLALAVGSLAAINAWDTPTYMAVGVIGLGIGEFARRRRVDNYFVARWAVVGVALVALAYLLFLPFHQGYEPFPTGVKSSLQQTPFYQYLGVHGIFFVLTLTFLVLEGVRRLGWRPWALNGGGLLGLWSGLPYARRGIGDVHPNVVILGLATVFMVVLASVGYETVGVMVLLLILAAVLAAWWLVKGGAEAPVHLFVLLMLGLAMAIGAGVDLVTAEGDIDRMNTVFKFYLQGWVLYALAGGFIAWYLVVSGFFRPTRHGWPLKGMWLTLVVLLLVASSVFPVLGTRGRLRDRFQVLPLTLNGTAFTQDAVYIDPNGPVELRWDAQAIQWLRENVQGSPVVLEAAIPDQYRWGSRVSIYTGLPTVVGWKWHQEQQRAQYSALVGRRHREVKDIYTATDPERALELLRRYDVTYIYLGPVERLYYEGPGLKKFDAWVGSRLETVYSNPQVKIYRFLDQEAPLEGDPNPEPSPS